MDFPSEINYLLIPLLFLTKMKYNGIKFLLLEMIPLKKLLIIPCLIFLLSGCTTNGIDSNLYKDGKDIIQMTNNNIKNGIPQFSDSQMMKIDNFRAKYSGKKMNGNNGKFIGEVDLAVLDYMGYGTNNGDEHYLTDYHQYLDKLKNDFNINVN